MKLKIFTVAMVLLSGLFSAHGGERDITKIWNNPDPLLIEIRSQIDNPHRNHDDEKSLAGNIQTLAHAISEDLYKAKSPDWATPTAERKAVIQKWADILAPETQKLVELAFGQGFGKTRSSVQARSLLDYAPATPAFADQVRKYINQSLDDSFSAADLLYEHRLLSDADKEALRQLRPPEEREYDLEGWAVGMSSLGMLDGLELAKKALSKEPQGETPKEITRRYLNLLRIANYLGPDAAILLPEIEALIDHPKIISSGYQKNFEYARDVITGKEPRQGRYAINSSGPLAVKIGDSPQSKIQDDQSRKGTSLGRSEKSHSPVDSKSSDAITEKPAPFPWWLIASSVVIFALALVTWLKLRKAKPTS